jgi:hypothetical protein
MRFAPPRAVSWQFQGAMKDGFVAQTDSARCMRTRRLSASKSFWSRRRVAHRARRSPMALAGFCRGGAGHERQGADAPQRGPCCQVSVQPGISTAVGGDRPQPQGVPDGAGTHVRSRLRVADRLFHVDALVDATRGKFRSPPARPTWLCSTLTWVYVGGVAARRARVAGPRQWGT